MERLHCLGSEQISQPGLLFSANCSNVLKNPANRSPCSATILTSATFFMPFIFN